MHASKEDVQSKANNGTCMVWKTPNVTFNFYLKTKTLQVQGKAVDPRLVLKHGTPECRNAGSPERRNTKIRNTKLLKPGTHEK